MYRRGRPCYTHLPPSDPYLRKLGPQDGGNWSYAFPPRMGPKSHLCWKHCWRAPPCQARQSCWQGSGRRRSTGRRRSSEWEETPPHQETSRTIERRGENNRFPFPPAPPPTFPPHVKQIVILSVAPPLPGGDANRKKGGRTRLFYMRTTRMKSEDLGKQEPVAWDFPGGSMVKNLPECRGHGFHPWSRKIPHAAEQLSLCATTTEPAL